jgi:hypothetical protein
MLDAIIEIERRFWEAAGDREAYAANLASDAVHVLPVLGVVDRETALRGVAEADPWEAYAIADARLVAAGEDTVALVYCGRARRAGQREYRAAITSVYRREDGSWMLVLHQQTPLDG